MKLLRAAVSVQAADVERAVAAFEIAGVHNSAVEWQVGEPVEEPSWGQPAPLPQQADVAAYLAPQRWREIAAPLTQALTRLWQPNPAPTVAVTDIPQRDWRTAWHEHFQIVRVRAARTIIIRPPHIAYNPKSNEVVIDLAPGLAFGTGQHQSTRLALALLADTLAHHQPFRTLDLGAGSGILAVAAAKLGAQAIDAVDIDPLAVDATRETARRNNVANQVRAHRASAPPNHRYNLVLANLTADLLQALAQKIAKSTAQNAHLIASGFLTERQHEVERALAAVGLHTSETRTEDDWCALSATAR